MDIKKKNVRLFTTFFKIGLFTIGGGFAMIPMMQQEIVDKNKWLSKDDFIDIMAVSQATPGIFAANMASHIGYKLGGYKSSIISLLANILPSIIIILIIAMTFAGLKNVNLIEHAFMGLRPAVVALIAVPVFSLLKSSENPYIYGIIALVSSILIYMDIISPILLIASTIIVSIIFTISTIKRIK